MNNYPDDIDEGIWAAVEILNKHGFTTFESCQGGDGHCFQDPTVRFLGEEFDLIRAYEICKLYGLNPLEAKRVYLKTSIYEEGIKEIGIAWCKPYNEITFSIHIKTGTIYLP